MFMTDINTSLYVLKDKFTQRDDSFFDQLFCSKISNFFLKKFWTVAEISNLKFLLKYSVKSCLPCPVFLKATFNVKASPNLLLFPTFVFSPYKTYKRQ